MKTQLNKEESQHLIDLGIPKEKASKVAVKQIQNWDRKPRKNPKEYVVNVPHTPIVMGFETFEEHPIFTLDDFLNGEILPRLLPKGNNKHYKLTIHTTENLKWSVSYLDMDNYVDFYHMNTLKVEVELIDALYQLTCWYYGEHLKNMDEA